MVETKEMTIASEVRSVMVNDRGTWVWHEDGMARMERTETPRDPEPYLVSTPDGPRFPTVNGAGDELKRYFVRAGKAALGTKVPR